MTDPDISPGASTDDRAASDAEIPEPAPTELSSSNPCMKDIDTLFSHVQGLEKKIQAISRSKLTSAKEEASNTCANLTTLLEKLQTDVQKLQQECRQWQSMVADQHITIEQLKKQLEHAVLTEDFEEHASEKTTPSNASIHEDGGVSDASSQAENTAPPVDGNHSGDESDSPTLPARVSPDTPGDGTLHPSDSRPDLASAILSQEHFSATPPDKS